MNPHTAYQPHRRGDAVVSEQEWLLGLVSITEVFSLTDPGNPHLPLHFFHGVRAVVAVCCVECAGSAKSDQGTQPGLGHWLCDIPTNSLLPLQDLHVDQIVFDCDKRRWFLIDFGNAKLKFECVSRSQSGYKLSMTLTRERIGSAPARWVELDVIPGSKYLSPAEQEFTRMRALFKPGLRKLWLRIEDACKANTSQEVLVALQSLYASLYGPLPELSSVLGEAPVFTVVSGVEQMEAAPNLSYIEVARLERTRAEDRARRNNRGFMKQAEEMAKSVGDSPRRPAAVRAAVAREALKSLKKRSQRASPYACCSCLRGRDADAPASAKKKDVSAVAGIAAAPGSSVVPQSRPVTVIAADEDEDVEVVSDSPPRVTPPPVVAAPPSAVSPPAAASLSTIHAPASAPIGCAAPASAVFAAINLAPVATATVPIVSLSLSPEQSESQSQSRPASDGADSADDRDAQPSVRKASPVAPGVDWEEPEPPSADAALPPPPSVAPPPPSVAPPPPSTALLLLPPKASPPSAVVATAPPVAHLVSLPPPLAPSSAPPVPPPPSVAPPRRAASPPPAAAAALAPKRVPSPPPKRAPREPSPEIAPAPSPADAASSASSCSAQAPASHTARNASPPRTASASQEALPPPPPSPSVSASATPAPRSPRRSQAQRLEAEAAAWARRQERKAGAASGASEAPAPVHRTSPPKTGASPTRPKEPRRAEVPEAHLVAQEALAWQRRLERRMAEHHQ